MKGEFVTSLALTQTATNPHPIKTRVIVGIYIEKDKLLLTKKFNHHTLHLPGGTVGILNDGLMQTQVEELQLSKFFYSKAGRNIFPIFPFLEISKEKLDKPIKAYFVSDKKIHAKALYGKWQKDNGFEPIWIPLEKIMNHPNIPETIRAIIGYFLMYQKDIEKSTHRNFKPVEVITIAN